MENTPQKETLSGLNSPFDAETVLEVTVPAREAAAAFSATLNETVQACQKEYAGFLQLRVTENLALTSKLMACRSLPEVQQAYADYWRRMAEQYGREYGQMFHILHDTGPDAVKSESQMGVRRITPVGVKH